MSITLLWLCTNVFYMTETLIQTGWKCFLTCAGLWSSPGAPGGTGRRCPSSSRSAAGILTEAALHNLTGWSSEYLETQTRVKIIIAWLHKHWFETTNLSSEKKDTKAFICRHRFKLTLAELGIMLTELWVGFVISLCSNSWFNPAVNPAGSEKDKEQSNHRVRAAPSHLRMKTKCFRPSPRLLLNQRYPEVYRVAKHPLWSDPTRSDKTLA